MNVANHFIKKTLIFKKILYLRLIFKKIKNKNKNIVNFASN